MNMRSRRVLAASLALIALLAVSCGRKTDPLIPESPRPETVRDVTSATRDAVTFLSWRVPSKNMEGKDLNASDIFGFRVFRAELKRDRKKSRFHQVGEIVLANPSPAAVKNGMVFWSDGPLRYSLVYAYRIVAVSLKGGVSLPSEEVRAVPLLSLAVPKNVTALAGENNVALAWESVSTRADGSTYGGFIGYNLYRTNTPGVYGAVPLNMEPIRTPSYVDLAVEIDKEYAYVVRAVDSPALPWKESLDSAETSATPRKLTPPLQPSGLTVVPGVGRVFLTWNENRERDLAGYNVYRSTKSRREYARLTAKPIMRTTFSDEAVQAGRTYYYIVTAVDLSGNESKPSREQKAYPEMLR